MNDLVYRLRKRAEIRRQIPTRKSVQEGRPDRIADLLEEAADYIENFEWVGLTDEERDECINGTAWVGEEKEVRVKIVEAIEAKLKEING